MTDLRVLQERLGYRFKDTTILENALTHPSYASAPSNQRLEFLGDAVLQLCVSDRLIHLYTDMDEGKLSRVRASIVREESLAACASALGIGDWLRFGRGERSAGGAHKASVLADALEAIIGAMYLDGGLAAANRFVGNVLAEAIGGGERSAQRDYKTELQEMLQKTNKTTPGYRLISKEGPAHASWFVVECLIGGQAVAEGSGRTKKQAEQQAAENALRRVRGGEVCL